MIRRPPRSTPLYSSAASDVYKRQLQRRRRGTRGTFRARIRRWVSKTVHEPVSRNRRQSRRTREFRYGVRHESSLVFIIIFSFLIVVNIPLLSEHFAQRTVGTHLLFSSLFWHFRRYARSVFLKVLEAHGATIFNRDELFANLFDEKLVVRNQNHASFEIRDGFRERFARF